MNELIFIFHTIVIGLTTLGAVFLGSSALTTFITLMYVFANLFVIKQIIFCGLHATASDALSIGAFLGFNLLQEFFGKAPARKALIISFCGALLYALLSQIHLWYIPSNCDQTDYYFRTLLSNSPRIITASLLSYLLTQILDYYLYGFLQKRLRGRYFILRNYTSLMITQLLDTVLFSFLGLYGIVDHISDIIIVSYTIKLITIFLETPWLWLAHKLYKPLAK